MTYICMYVQYKFMKYKWTMCKSQLVHELLWWSDPALPKQQLLPQDTSEDQFWSVYGCVYGM